VRRLLLILISVYALAAAVYVLLPGGMEANASTFGAPLPPVPLWVLALANAGLVLVAYGAMAFGGDALARRAGLVGALPAKSRPADLWLRPALVGVAAGIGLVAGDRLTAAVSSFPGFPHPPFPSSLLASLTAGIGEEIAFRLFLLSLWALVLTWLARVLGGPGLRPATLATANVLAALAFAAGHLGSALMIAGVTSPAALPAAELIEMVVLNGGLGLLAGRAYLRHGLLAAAGVHFWADIVWHVLFPLIAGG
jgi:hypothetical protein